MIFEASLLYFFKKKKF